MSLEVLAAAEAAAAEVDDAAVCVSAVAGRIVSVKVMHPDSELMVLSHSLPSALFPAAAASTSALAPPPPPPPFPFPFPFDAVAELAGGPATRVLFTPVARSSAVRSSTLCAMHAHLVSVSTTLPFSTGVAAVKAKNRGANTASWSNMYRDSSTSRAWKVTWRQQHPIPNAMASISATWGHALALAAGEAPAGAPAGAAGPNPAPFTPARPSALSPFVAVAALAVEGELPGLSTALPLPSTTGHPSNSGVRVSRKRGIRMSTLLPLRLRMFCVSAPKRGCGLMHASGMLTDSEMGLLPKALQLLLLLPV
mmetsp:Transcript_10386/g.19088  ORF Transcript_10386/g.19088 Transcript_10386/m.19088 type:complete len:309 (-) Transcript_10386:729-1655(-)